MSLSKLKPETQRALAIAVPVVVVLFAAFLIIPKLGAIWTVQRQAEARRAEAALRKQQNQAELAAESKERLPACPESKDEALIFLRELSRVVAISQVKLVSYRPPAAAGNSAGAAAATTGGSTAADRASLVKPLATEITVSGSYGDLVALFQTLAARERLYTVDDLQVRTNAYPRLTAVFQLTRYVTPPSIAIAQARAAAALRVASADAGVPYPGMDVRAGLSRR
jgi:hypothetical protein